MCLDEYKWMWEWEMQDLKTPPFFNNVQPAPQTCAWTHHSPGQKRGLKLGTSISNSPDPLPDCLASIFYAVVEAQQGHWLCMSEERQLFRAHETEARRLGPAESERGLMWAALWPGLIGRCHRKWIVSLSGVTNTDQQHVLWCQWVLETEIWHPSVLHVHKDKAALRGVNQHHAQHNSHWTLRGGENLTTNSLFFSNREQIIRCEVDDSLICSTLTFPTDEVTFQAKLPKICWFQPLKCEHILIFFVWYDGNLIFGFGAVVLAKTINLTLRNCGGYCIFFYRLELNGRCTGFTVDRWKRFTSIFTVWNPAQCKQLCRDDLTPNSSLRCKYRCLVKQLCFSYFKKKM